MHATILNGMLSPIAAWIGLRSRRAWISMRYESNSAVALTEGNYG
jgi:hypothetical protein